MARITWPTYSANIGDTSRLRPFYRLSSSGKGIQSTLNDNFMTFCWVFQSYWYSGTVIGSVHEHRRMLAGHCTVSGEHSASYFPYLFSLYTYIAGMEVYLSSPSIIPCLHLMIYVIYATPVSFLPCPWKREVLLSLRTISCRSAAW